MKLSFAFASNRGFALLDVVVACSVAGALVTLILVQNKNGHERALRTSCVKNVRQLQFALTQYLADHNGVFPIDRGAQVDGQWRTLQGWVVGNAKSSGTLDSLTRGAIYPYVRSIEPYRCPSDKSLLFDGPQPRLRSYSLNLAVSSHSHGATFVAVRLSNIPQPQRVFSFIDEEPISINDGAFAVHPLETQAWWDVPADRHHQGGTLAFLDGHAEYWQWRAPKRGTPPGSPPQSAEDDADLHQLRTVAFLRQPQKWINP